MGKYDCLKLENQLCFPLYACAKEIVRRYTPILEKPGLTYTQYIAMLILWEKGELSVKDLGKCLYLDSGTLTPLLKKLEGKGYVARHRGTEDERTLLVHATPEGMALREELLDVPEQVGGCVALSPEETETLYRLLYKILGGLEEEAGK